MAVITRDEILERMKKGDLKIIPSLDSFQLQGHAVDLRLGFTFLVPRVWHLTSRGREALDTTNFDKLNAQFFDIIELEETQYFDLLPGEHILVGTLETIGVPKDLMGVLYPRSSVNRKGLSVDLTGIIDSGYEGQLTIPIRNSTPSQVVRLYPGERICQVVFEQLTHPIRPRLSKYHKRDIAEGVKREKRIESALILAGKVKQLKEKHRIG